MTTTTTVLADDGGWCWFQDPRAVRHAGSHDRTYVGWISRGGDVRVGQFDHARKRVTSTTLHADYERDDHDAPAIAVRPDGRLIVFYTRHNGPAVNYRVSREPESVSSFEPERTLEFDGSDRRVTYPNPRWIDGDLHLFLRCVADGEGRVVTMASPDDGETWSEPRPLVTTGGDGWCVYAKVSRCRDGEVHLGFTHAFGGRNEPHRHVTHAMFDGTVLRASDGTALGRVDDGTLPVRVDDTTTVFDSDERGHDAWIWDCAAVGGTPQLSYAQLVSEREHRYRYARWNGREWEDELLCHGGSHVTPIGGEETYYSGGVVLDHDAPGVCYASVGSHESSVVDRFERRKDGWRVTRIADPDAQHLRPVVPWNRNPELAVCWVRGRYDYYAPARSGDGKCAFETAVVGRSLPDHSTASTTSESNPSSSSD